MQSISRTLPSESSRVSLPAHISCYTQCNAMQLYQLPSLLKHEPPAEISRMFESPGYISRNGGGQFLVRFPSTRKHLTLLQKYGIPNPSMDRKKRKEKPSDRSEKWVRHEREPSDCSVVLRVWSARFFGFFFLEWGALSYCITYYYRMEPRNLTATQAQIRSTFGHRRFFLSPRRKMGNANR